MIGDVGVGTQWIQVLLINRRQMRILHEALSGSERSRQLVRSDTVDFEEAVNLGGLADTLLGEDVDRDGILDAVDHCPLMQRMTPTVMVRIKSYFGVFADSLVSLRLSASCGRLVLDCVLFPLVLKIGAGVFLVSAWTNQRRTLLRERTVHPVQLLVLHRMYQHCHRGPM